ncbi:MAG: glycosyltransferase [Chloroflexi bacterium]|nr:glycosyltransferase [Chloroflexota bacterium]
MSDALLIPVAVVYLLVMGALFLYGLNFYYVTWLAYRTHDRAVPEPLAESECPLVTVQLPVYNELYVVRRLIDAAAQLDYPRQRLEIQILDDSTDGTTRIAEQAAAAWREQGVNVAVVHRSDRSGYKAGALRSGMEQTQGELLAVFDADFLPPRDFLRRTVGWFADPKVAFVQARWGHINRDYSFLTLLQSLAIDAHFMIEQQARSWAGYFFNFNGTAGVWRKSVVAASGGWQARTLTEDLDLSYRAFLSGWKGVYLRDLVAPAELPATFNGFRQQQQRWATGSFQCARLLLPEVWGSSLPLLMKLEATLHLTGYSVHLLLCLLCLLYPFVLGLSVKYPALISLFGIAVAFNFTALAPTAMFYSAQRQKGERVSARMFLVLLFISSFGSGMMLNTVRAALRAMRSMGGEFKRTPKHGVRVRGERLRGGAYHIRLDPIVFWELGFGLFNFWTAAQAIRLENWFIAFYAALFGFGLLFTASYTLWQTLTLRLGEPAVQSDPA